MTIARGDLRSPWRTSLTLSFTRSHARSSLSMAGRISQAPESAPLVAAERGLPNLLQPGGAFWPTSIPVFHGPPAPLDLIAIPMTELLSGGEVQSARWMQRQPLEVLRDGRADSAEAMRGQGSCE